MYFTPSHEYVCVDGDVATVGITDHAAGALGDVVYVELPDKGDAFEVGDSFGSVESVKAASDIYLPVGGEVSVVCLVCPLLSVACHVACLVRAVPLQHALSHTHSHTHTPLTHTTRICRYWRLTLC